MLTLQASPTQGGNGLLHAVAWGLVAHQVHSLEKTVLVMLQEVLLTLAFHPVICKGQELGTEEQMSP